MKTCPACQRTYYDDTLSFCLEDGSLLSAPIDPNKTLQYQNPDPSVVTEVRSYIPAPTQAAPTAASLPPPTGNIEPGPLPFAQIPQPAPVRDSGRPGMKLFLLFLVIVFGVTGIGILAMYIVNRPDPADRTRSQLKDARNADLQASPSPTKTGDRSKSEQSNTTITPTTPAPTVQPTHTPTATPTPESPKTPSEPRFTAMLNNVSYSGDNLTYYRGSTAAQCRADCARNPRCVGFTYIKAAGYNPGDPPMCYLAARITSQSSHKCCISARKQ